MMVSVDRVLIKLPRFMLLPGQRHDSVGVEPLIEDMDFDAVGADKTFDNNWLRAEPDKRGIGVGVQYLGLESVVRPGILHGHDAISARPSTTTSSHSRSRPPKARNADFTTVVMPLKWALNLVTA